MRVTRFTPAKDLIIITAQIWGPRGQLPAHLAVDTAATETLVVPGLLDSLGYSPRSGEAITVIHSAIGKEQGYMTRVSRFSALGFSSSNFRIHAHDLPDGYGIDGLLGLSFLAQLNYEVRSLEGRLLAERASSKAS